MVDHNLNQIHADEFGFETAERASEAWPAFENGRLMMGGINEAQNLAENVPDPGYRKNGG